MRFNEQMFLKSDLILIRIVLIYFEFYLRGKTSKIVPKVVHAFFFFFLVQRLSSMLHIFIQQPYTISEKLG